MLTVTRDMVMPTAITGSYPRPLWYDVSLNGRSFKTAMGDSLFREQYLDAVAAVINAAGGSGPRYRDRWRCSFRPQRRRQILVLYPIERLGGVTGHRDLSRGWMSRPTSTGICLSERAGSSSPRDRSRWPVTHPVARSGRKQDLPPTLRSKRASPSVTISSPLPPAR